MRAYLQQVRQETGLRLCDKVFDPETDKPSKVRVVYNALLFCKLLDAAQIWKNPYGNVENIHMELIMSHLDRSHTIPI